MYQPHAYMALSINQYNDTNVLIADNSQCNHRQGINIEVPWCNTDGFASDNSVSLIVSYTCHIFWHDTYAIKSMNIKICTVFRYT